MASFAIVIPEVQLGRNLLTEYREGLDSDEGLEEWTDYGKRREKGFFWRGEVLYRIIDDEVRGVREVVVVLKVLRRRLLKLTHEFRGHIEAGKMNWALRQRCVWLGMNGSIRAYCKSCFECQCMRKQECGRQA